MKKIFLLIIYLILSGSPVWAAAPVISNAEITSISDTSMVITWKTNVLSLATVEYGIGSLYESKTSAEAAAHYVEITGLTPNRTYTYRISSSNNDGTTREAQSTFSTLTQPTGNYLFSFASMSDLRYAESKADSSGLRGKPYSQAGNITSAMVNQIKLHSPAFTILKGGMLEENIADNLVNKLNNLTSAEGTRKYYPIPGVTEKSVLGNNWITNGLAKLLPDYNSTFGIANSPGTDSVFNYSFDYKGYHFILLDSVKADASKGYVNTTWLNNDLSVNSGKKCFIFMNIPGGGVSESFPTGFISAESTGWEIENKSAFAAVVNNYPNSIAGIFAGYIHDNGSADVADLPYVRTASALQFPTGYNVYKVYTNGYIQTFYKTPQYSENARALISGEGFATATLVQQAWLGGLSARNFTKTYAVRDDVNPVITITAPASAAAVSEKTNITGSAVDNMEISRIELYVDEVLKATKEASPYSFSWNSNTVSNGIHSIKVSAFDLAGNRGDKTITVNVSNDTPRVNVLAPKGGQNLIGNSVFNITWTVSFESAISGVKIYYSTDSGATYPNLIAAKSADIQNSDSYAWTVPNLNASQARILVQATSIGSKVGSDESESDFSITKEDTTTPGVSLAAITNNATSNLKPTFTGMATDEQTAITSVECRIDQGNWISAEARDGSFNSSSEAFVSYTPVNLNRGIHTLEARAWDSQSNLTSPESYASYTFYITGSGPAISGNLNGGRTLNNDPLSSTPLIEATVATAQDLDLNTVRIVIDNLTTITAGITKTKIRDGEYTISYQVPSGSAFSAGNHSIRLEMQDVRGTWGTWEVSGLLVASDTSVPEIQGTPLNYPNPFAPAWSGNPAGGTTLAYTLTKDAAITLCVFDINGNQVYKTAYPAGSTGGKVGYNEVSWNGQTNGGTPAGNGIYVYLILNNSSVIARGKLAVFKP